MFRSGRNAGIGSNRDRTRDHKYSQPPSYRNALNIASRGPDGVAWAVSDRDVQEIMDDFELTWETDMEKAGGPMVSGNKGCVFMWNGQEMRLEKVWTGSYNLYKGRWKPDPRWRGD